MPFWRTAVAPCIRPVHLTIIVPGGMVPGSIGRRQYAPSTALVSYNFPGVAPGDFRVSIPTPSSAAHPWPKPQTQMGAPSIFPEAAVRPLKTPSFPGEHSLGRSPKPNSPRPKPHHCAYPRPPAGRRAGPIFLRDAALLHSLTSPHGCAPLAEAPSPNGCPPFFSEAAVRPLKTPSFSGGASPWPKPQTQIFPS